MTASASVVTRAHAKINLSLRVVGRRADGFHELKTIFQSLTLHDTLTFVRRPGSFAIACTDGRVPTDQANVVWRAAVLLWRVAGRGDQPQDTHVTITKRIPVAAGLGGGSTDAAAALVSLARLWKLPQSHGLLADVAAGLGADVPYFLTGGTALGLERGDEIYPLPDLPRISVLLVLPAFGISTAEAYGWYDEDASLRNTRGSMRASRVPSVWSWPSCEVVNDLQPPVARRRPVIGDMVEVLRDCGAEAAAMTGSGSAVFGLFSHARRAARAAEACRGRRWGVIATTTLGREGYQARSRPVLKRGRNLSGGVGVV